MRPLLTIHGVGWLGERGKWQDSIEWVVAPHFEYTAKKYSHYRWLGLIVAVIEPWVILPGGLLFVAMVSWTNLNWVWLLLIAIFIVLMSVLTPSERRRFAARNVARQSSTAFDQRPHIIAHSMGTQIIGRALQQQPSFRASRIILVGCVLPANFDWNSVYGKNEFSFTHVRNEVAEDDLVPLVAEKMSRTKIILRGFGSAGRGGFQEDSILVHHVDNPNATCQQCANGACRPSVHNVVNKFGHADALERDHVAYFLLPWLWGVEPAEYSLWIESCLTAARQRSERGSRPLLFPAEELLLKKRWKWIDTVDTEGLSEIADNQMKGKTLREYVAHVVSSITGVMADPSLIISILRRTCIAVERATNAHIHRTSGWEMDIRSLNPGVAVWKAISECIDDNANTT